MLHVHHDIITLQKLYAKLFFEIYKSHFPLVKFLYLLEFNELYSVGDFVEAS